MEINNIEIITESLELAGFDISRANKYGWVDIKKDGQYYGKVGPRYDGQTGADDEDIKRRAGTIAEIVRKALKGVA